MKFSIRPAHSFPPPRDISTYLVKPLPPVPRRESQSSAFSNEVTQAFATPKRTVDSPTTTIHWNKHEAYGAAELDRRKRCLPAIATIDISNIPDTPSDEILSPQPRQSIPKILRLTSTSNLVTSPSPSTPSGHQPSRKVRQLMGTDLSHDDSYITPIPGSSSAYSPSVDGSRYSLDMDVDRSDFDSGLVTNISAGVLSDGTTDDITFGAEGTTRCSSWRSVGGDSGGILGTGDIYGRRASQSTTVRMSFSSVSRLRSTRSFSVDENTGVYQPDLYHAATAELARSSVSPKTASRCFAEHYSGPRSPRLWTPYHSPTSQYHPDSSPSPIPRYGNIPSMTPYRPQCVTQPTQLKSVRSITNLWSEATPAMKSSFETEEESNMPGRHRLEVRKSRSVIDLLLRRAADSEHGEVADTRDRQTVPQELQPRYVPIRPPPPGPHQGIADLLQMSPSLGRGGLSSLGGPAVSTVTQSSLPSSTTTSSAGRALPVIGDRPVPSQAHPSTSVSSRRQNLYVAFAVRAGAWVARTGELIEQARLAAGVLTPAERRREKLKREIKVVGSRRLDASGEDEGSKRARIGNIEEDDEDNELAE
jgi:hypothetical protein